MTAKNQKNQISQNILLFKRKSDSSKKLFQFLKAFNNLKKRPTLDVNSFKKVLWFYDVPNERECYSITHKDNLKTATFDKWIEIKKPNRKAFPEPSNKIRPWLKENTLYKYTIPPQLYSYIIEGIINQEDSMSSEEENDKRALLEDHPEIKEEFNNYLNKKWIPWAEEEKRIQPVLKIYNDLYKIYKTNKDQGEVYQIALGLGLLSSKNKRGNIKRHIVETPVFISFNSTTGTITVKPFEEQGAELSLEMDMLEENKKPDNSKEIKSKLSDLSNDFWKNEQFFNCLKGWLNSYDSEGQFHNNFNKPSPNESFSTLSVSPAIILRKRNERAFITFYNEVIKDIENEKRQPRPCLKEIFNENKTSKQDKIFEENSKKRISIAEKHYFPLTVNEEQEKIITKLQNNSQIVVQGPPGTGKTHSIANLISHFLATGQKILVTSQTDRALKVLREKLPKKLQKLCIEILGRDQQSLQELKTSFNAINSKYQEWNPETNKEEIKKLEDNDDKLKGKIAEVKNQLFNIKKFESRQYEKLFDFYTGSPAVIASYVKLEEEKYKWLQEEFSLKPSDKCPISNREAESFLTAIEKIKDIEDSVLKETIEFSDKIFSLEELKDKITKEQKAKQIIKEYTSYEKTNKGNYYKDLSDDALEQLKDKVVFIDAKATNLLNREELWIKQALKDCLNDRDREWRYLYNSTQETLEKNKEIFLSSEKIRKIEINTKIPPNDFYLTKLLEDFFKQYNPNEKIRWGIFCSKTIRDLKKIKIDKKRISSYEEVKKFDNYVKSKRAFEKINNFWKNQGIDIKKTRDRNFMKNYHIFKDFCEPLDECLRIHKAVENIKQILEPYNIAQFQWTTNVIKEESKAIKLNQGNRLYKQVEKDFEKFSSYIETYKNQKNQIAKKILSALEKRNLQDYKKALNQISEFKMKKENFSKICEINKKLNNNTFYHNLKKDINNPIWRENLKSFEQAWAWKRADEWLKEEINTKSLKELEEERKDLLERQRKNMESLIVKKAWGFCLSQITDKEVSSLKGWIQAISKVGKGTGITASKHRKVAKKRMEECKTAIPAWIMPLYRVVENIKPNAEPFDIAIIDEASQTGPDGFLLNYIAKKIIVVGDKEQISPENPGMKDEDVEILKKKYISDIKFSEHIGREYSYYDYFETRFTKSHIQLREHFRCMPEIIQFSNTISYSGTPLIPLRQYGSSRLPPIKNIAIQEAVSKVGSGKEPQNQKEAEAILNQIKECIKDPKYKDKTFGIIVLQGKAQIQIIEKALVEQLDKREIEKRYIQVGDAYDFQGDERDIIFLSMAISKDWPTSALTRETYRKRYNVAASRAKDQMWLFHSIALNDLNNKEDFRYKLLSHVQSYQKKEKTIWPQEKLNELYNKIKQTKNKSPDNAPDPFDSWFEARVFHRIASKGYQVISQYRVSNYKIDMIILGSKKRLAVECDGDYFHSEGKKKEQDLERQWKLEKLGWTFWRLGESRFNRDEEEAIKDLWSLLDKMQIAPL